MGRSEADEAHTSRPTPEFDALSRRTFVVLGFVALMVFPLALLPRHDIHLGLVAPAGVITLIVLLGGWWLLDRDAPSWTQPVPALTYLVVIVLLRQAGGGAPSGFSPLLLLPLVWIALYGNSRSLAILTFGIAATLAGPILLVGDPLYPATEWRRTAIWLLVGPTLGSTIQSLVLREREATMAMAMLARTDALTALPNRRAYAEHAERELLRARRTGVSLALVVMDLDRFKSYNDAHGHQCGDLLLREAAIAWVQAARADDLVARWGGEEFAIVLPAFGTEADLLAAVERIRNVTPLGQTVSAGIAIWDGREDLDSLEGRADAAVYRAKDGGRDRAELAR